MAPLRGFSDNPFRRRSDLIQAAAALLKPLERYKSQDNARIRISTESGAGFDEVAAQLEGFARPLWVVANLLYLLHADENGGNNDEELGVVRELNLESWLRGIAAGTDPSSGEYWGDLGNFDQRMVEMESIAYALLTTPRVFDSSLDSGTRERLATWLKQINSRKMPQSNWLWFRVFVNLTQEATPTTHQMIEFDLNTLDTFYLGDGWSSDGLWSEERQQADYYSGSFAIQFAKLLFVTIIEDRGAYDAYRERIERYKDEARQFALTFWRYFDVNSAAIPFGRSLTYRFAFAAFWSAIVVANVDLSAPLDELGVVKGLLLRHFRWWSQHTGIFNPDGTLNIGFTYPNMYMSEDYNSPQSVYWSLKSFIVVGLRKEHPFWSWDELPHPLDKSSPKTRADQDAQESLGEVSVIWPPRHILCNTKEHHFLLSSGQSTGKHHRAREAKYGKFAYSSTFGFSVPTGPLLEQLAPDSTLCISLDDGDTWRPRWKPFDVHIQYVDILSPETTAEKVPALTSTWKPQRNTDVEIKTTLVAPAKQWPGWHLRVHRVRWKSSNLIDGNIQLMDSGFASSGQGKNGLLIPEVIFNGQADLGNSELEGWSKTETSCLIFSDGGASGVVDLTKGVEEQQTKSSDHNQITRTAVLLRPDANTNIVSQRTLIPTVQLKITQSTGANSTSKDVASSDDPYHENWLVTGVFSIAKSSGLNTSGIQGLWNEKPLIALSVVEDVLTLKIELSKK